MSEIMITEHDHGLELRHAFKGHCDYRNRWRRRDRPRLSEISGEEWDRVMAATTCTEKGVDDFGLKDHSLLERGAHEY